VELVANSVDEGVDLRYVIALPSTAHRKSRRVDPLGPPRENGAANQRTCRFLGATRSPVRSDDVRGRQFSSADGDASVGWCTERASQPGRNCRNVIDVDETPIKHD